MADVWTDERPDHGKWKVVADDGDARYVSNESLASRKAHLEKRLRDLATERSREELRIEAELAQVDGDITQIAIEEAAV